LPLPPVHPHTHGEHQVRVLHTDTCDGSSPHAWGTHDLLPVPDQFPRFIPTRMGNTPPQRLVTGARSVHPHTHGEHEPMPSVRYSTIGSSPHAWGTRKPAGIPRNRIRFIPTRMGNTRCYCQSIARVSVHPHTHGEHVLCLDRGLKQFGSSPHAWGTHSSVAVSVFDPRFIPTRMGNTA